MSGGKFKARRINAGIQAGVDEAIAQTKASQEAERQERIAAYRAREAARRRFTYDELREAVAVRAYSRWLEVVRVNPKSVTVLDENGLHCRIPHHEITGYGNPRSTLISAYQTENPVSGN